MACDHHVAAAHELFLSRLVETAFVRRWPGQSVQAGTCERAA